MLSITDDESQYFEVEGALVCVHTRGILGSDRGERGPTREGRPSAGWSSVVLAILGTLQIEWLSAYAVVRKVGGERNEAQWSMIGLSAALLV